jgi:hypothetical protein
MPDGLYGGMAQRLLVDGGAVVVTLLAVSDQRSVFSDDPLARCAARRG